MFNKNYLCPYCCQKSVLTTFKCLMPTSDNPIDWGPYNLINIWIFLSIWEYNLDVIRTWITVDRCFLRYGHNSWNYKRCYVPNVGQNPASYKSTHYNLIVPLSCLCLNMYLQEITDISFWLSIVHQGLLLICCTPVYEYLFPLLLIPRS